MDGSMTNKRCKFKEGKWHCGSYAFNLHAEGIKQGNYCDQHYWQDRALKAEAMTQLVEPTDNEWLEWWRVSAIAYSTEVEIDFGDFLMIAQDVVDKLKETNK